jgi:hypothetical protein
MKGAQQLTSIFFDSTVKRCDSEGVPFMAFRVEVTSADGSYALSHIRVQRDAVRVHFFLTLCQVLVPVCASRRAGGGGQGAGQGAAAVSGQDVDLTQ